MVINIEILSLSDKNASDVDMDDEADKDMQEAVLTTVDNAHIFDVVEIELLVGNDLIEEVLFACNENKSHIVLIIGNVGPVGIGLVTETINSIINIEELSQEVAGLISNIQTRLNEIMPHKTICGIRNQTLVIHLSGPCTNIKTYLEAIKDMMLQTIHLIRTDEDQNVLLHDVATTSSYNYMEQEETMKAAVKRRKKSTSPLLSPNSSVVKRQKDSFLMISVADALNKMYKIMDKNLEEITPETVQLSDACGRILCETVKSTCNLPPFRISTKHGYAVLVSDGKGLRKVCVTENKFPPTPLEPGTCVWVRGGTQIPDGATAVVSVIDTKPAEDPERRHEAYIEIMVEPQSEDNIKCVGYDLKEEETISTSYSRIGPMEIGLLAATGRKEVSVVKKVSIGVLSIGDNLQERGEVLKPGCIYDANRITIVLLLEEKGIHSVDFGIVDNEMTSIKDKIEKALRKVNVLVTVGSTNDRNLMKIILERYYRAKIHFGNLNITPGKSTIFATCMINDTKKHLFCLPRNPVSVLMAMRIFVVPFVSGVYYRCLSAEFATISARLEHNFIRHSRPRAAWAILEWMPKEYCAMIYSNKGNAVRDKLFSVAGANTLLFLPERNKQKVLPKFMKAILIKLPKRCNDRLIGERRLPKLEDSSSSKQSLRPNPIFLKTNKVYLYDKF